MTFKLWVAFAILGMACSADHPDLSRAEAHRRLLAYHVEATRGLFRDTAEIDFALKRDGDDARHVVNGEGERVGTFVWSEGRWQLVPSRELRRRLERWARDRPQVVALGARVDSVEAAIVEFERTLADLTARADGSAPWRWRLEQARKFLVEMEAYAEDLHARGEDLSGAAKAVDRIDDLLETVREVRRHVERELGGADERRNGR